MTNTCIIVASHIPTAVRIKCLCNCLVSLLAQTVLVPIILSISFENELVFVIYKRQMEIKKLFYNENIRIIYNPSKTAQFRHIFNVFELVKQKYDYFMFCDDDDTYERTRVEEMLLSIVYGSNGIQPNKVLVGAFEYNGNIEDNYCREYWAYCLKTSIIQDFITKINDGGFNEYVDNFMFDVVFGSYIQSLDNNYIFVAVTEKMYNYNIRDDSVSGKWKDYMLGKAPQEMVCRGKVDLNEKLERDILILKQNIFYVLSVGSAYDVFRIIKERSFMSDELIKYLNQDSIQHLQNYYLEIKKMTDYLGIKNRAIFTSSLSKDEI